MKRRVLFSMPAVLKRLKSIFAMKLQKRYYCTLNSMNQKMLTRIFSAERLGLSMSLLCGVHCLAFPFLVTLSPVLPVHLEGFESVEHAIILVSVLVAGLTFFKDYRKHNKLMPIVLGVVAVLLFGLSGMLTADNEPVFVTGGSLLLIVAYGINYKMRKNVSLSCACHKG
jgi:cation transport ATPase